MKNSIHVVGAEYDEKGCPDGLIQPVGHSFVVGKVPWYVWAPDMLLVSIEALYVLPTDLEKRRCLARSSRLRLRA